MTDGPLPEGTQSAAMPDIVTALQPVGATPDLPLRASETIQGDILAAFNKDHRTFLFLRFPDATRARAWLSDLLPRVAKTKDVADFNARFSNARRLNGGTDPANLTAHWVSVSLTHHGLTTLDPSLAADLQAFGAFQAGPAARAADLGDTGLSDPARWVFGRPDQQIDVLLTVAADDPNDLLVQLDKLRALAATHGLITLFEQRGDTLAEDRAGHEHFGFKDGISQPGIRGFDPPDPANPRFVLGHHGTELIDAAQFVLGQTGNAQVPDPPAWMRDGSFQVFRRLTQDVPGFYAQVTEHVHSLPSDDPMTEDLLAAKLVGRWRSGTPLEIAPERDDRSTRDPGDDNDFTFTEDPQGLRCPQFAHIRKVYPRDLGFGDDQHRILRRGIPFGLEFDPTAGRGHGVDAERGLLFNAYMASIENQFEFLQQVWANNPNFPPEPDNQGPDPVIGDASRPSPVRIKREGRADLLLDFRRFVHTTGAVYAFAPSLVTLARLANGSTGIAATVTGNGVNLRSAPSLSASVLGQLQSGIQVTITGGSQQADGHTWFPVLTTDGRNGWVAGEFLHLSAIAVGGRATVTANGVNLRSAAGLRASILGQLQSGTQVTITGGPQQADGHTWWQVHTADGRNGWVAGEFVRPA